MKPFDLSPAFEPTTFALCLEVLGEKQSDGLEPLWVEINTRTLGFESESEAYEFDKVACNRLKALWSQWWAGRMLNPVFAQQFGAIRKDCQRTLKEVYGKPQGFTKGEFEQVAAEWHEALTRANYWDGILPPTPAPEIRGLKGWYGAGA